VNVRYVYPSPGVVTVPPVTVAPAEGVTLLLAAVYVPSPEALTALTRTVYAVPFVNPVSV
jgi:hypothetical protein